MCKGSSKFFAGEAERFTGPRGSVSFGSDSANSSNPESDGKRIFLIDDDPLMRERLGKALSALGWEPELFARSNDLAAKLETGFAEGKRPILLIDLIMPRFSGDGILGGLELLQFVRTHYPDLAVRMFSDFFCAETEKRIQDLGVARLLVKPRPECGTMDAESSMAVFIDEVVQTLPPIASSICQMAHRDDEKDGLTECSLTMPTAEASPLKQQLTLFENLSSELFSLEPGEQFRLLILRFAAELFDRSVIFSVIGGRLQATGQFGFDAMSGVHGHRLKELKIPLHESSIFSAVLERRVPFKEELSPEAWMQCFGDQLDAPPAGQVFLGPVICQEQVEIILYGDTLPDRPAIGETAALEIFLSQVGLVKEKERLKAALAVFSQQT